MLFALLDGPIEAAELRGRIQKAADGGRSRTTAYNVLGALEDALLIEIDQGTVRLKDEGRLRYLLYDAEDYLAAVHAAEARAADARRHGHAEYLRRHPEALYGRPEGEPLEDDDRVDFAVIGRAYRRHIASRLGPLEGQDGDRWEVPDITWVTSEDGSREPGEIEDRAARYDAVANRLTINADYSGYREMRRRWLKTYEHQPLSAPLVESYVRGQVEITLIQAVFRAEQMAATSDRREDIAELTSEAALTAALAPEVAVNRQLKHALAVRLGKARQREP